MANRSIEMAWKDFDDYTSENKISSKEKIKDLKESTNRWTIKQIDSLVEVLRDVASSNEKLVVPSEPEELDSRVLGEFGTIYSALRWAGVSDNYINTPGNVLLAGYLEIGVELSITTLGDGLIQRVTNPGTQLQQIVKKRLDSPVKSFQALVTPHHVISQTLSDKRVISLLRAINVPIKVV